MKILFRFQSIFSAPLIINLSYLIPFFAICKRIVIRIISSCHPFLSSIFFQNRKIKILRAYPTEQRKERRIERKKEFWKGIRIYQARFTIPVTTMYRGSRQVFAEG